MSNLPHRTPRTHKIFYGWYVLGVAALGGFFGAGGMSQVVMGVFLTPMTADLGWSRSATAGAITAGTAAAGLLSLFVGRLADRFGARWLATGGALIVSAAFVLLANVTHLWQFYVAYAAGRGVANATLGGVSSMTTATNWFWRYRGRAMGLVGMSVALGSSVLALLAQFVLEDRGWRTAFLVFGSITLVYAVPAALVIRRRPEDLGLLPDGAAPASTAAAAAPHAAAASSSSADEEFSWTLREAMGTRTLWLLIAGRVVSMMGGGAVGYNLADYYQNAGIVAAVAAASISAYALSGALASIIWGFLVERFSERHLVVVAMLASAVCMVALLGVRGPAAAIGVAVALGLASRGESALVLMLLAQYYGRRSYGTISGFLSPFQMFGLGVGPLIASLSFDLLGSYEAAFLGFAFAFLLSALLIWSARQPASPPRARPRTVPALPAGP